MPQDNKNNNNHQQGSVDKTIQTNDAAAGFAIFGLSMAISSVILWFLLNKILLALHVGISLPLVTVFCGFVILCILSFYCFYLPLFFVATYLQVQATYSTAANYKVLLAIMFKGIKNIQDKQEINIQKLIDDHIEKNYVDQQPQSSSDDDY